jgi:hypothetical protein
MGAKKEVVELSVAGHTVAMSSPAKALFPALGLTTLDLVHRHEA